MSDDDKFDKAEEEILAKKGTGRATLALVLDAVEKANRRAASTTGEAIEAVMESNKANQRRVFLIILVVLLLLAAVIGITASVELPNGTNIGFEPAKEAADGATKPKPK